MLEKLHGPAVDARHRGRPLDLLSVFGLRRSELRNAALLAALWDQRRCGRLAIDFLTACLARVDGGSGLPDRRVLERGYVVRTEDCPIGDGDDRVDVTLEGAGFLIGVEIKIDAPEGDRQLERYRTALQRRAAVRGLEMHLIYLSPRPPETVDEMHVDWMAIARAAEHVAGSRPDGSDFNARILAQFAEHARRF